MSMQKSEQILADLQKALAALGSETNLAEKKRNLQSLAHIITQESNHKVCIDSFDKILSVLRPLLADRTLKGPVMALMGQLGNVDSILYEKLISSHISLVFQSKQVEKRSHRLSQLVDYVSAAQTAWNGSYASKQHAASFLHAHVEVLVVNGWNCLDLKTIDVLLPHIMSLTLFLQAHALAELQAISSSLIRAVVCWGSQEMSESLVDKFLTFVGSLSPLISKSVPSILETIASLFREFAGIPLVPPSAAQGSKQSKESSSSAPPSSTPVSSSSSSSSAPTLATEAIATTVSATGAGKGGVSTSFALPRPNPAAAPSILRGLIAAYQGSLWHEAKVTFACLTTILTSARDIHRANHSFSHRYQWDIGCNALVTAFAENYARTKAAERPVEWESRQFTNFALCFADHLQTFPLMRPSKLVALLHTYTRFFNAFTAQTSGILSANSVRPFWHSDLFVLSHQHRNPEMAKLIYQLHAQIIKLRLDHDATEFIQNVLFADLASLSQLMKLHLPAPAALNGVKKSNQTTSEADGNMIGLCVQDVSLLTSLILHRMPTQENGLSNSTKWLVDLSKSTLTRICQILHFSRVPHLPPILQETIAKLVDTCLQIRSLSLEEVAYKDATVETFKFPFEWLLCDAVSAEAKVRTLKPLQSLSLVVSQQDIDVDRARGLYMRLLCLLADPDQQVRIEASFALLHLCSLEWTDSRGTHALVNETIRRSICDQLFVFGSLVDDCHQVRINLQRVLISIGIPEEHISQWQEALHTKPFSNWKSLIPLASVAIESLSFNDARSTAFGRSEFAAVLAHLSVADSTFSFGDSPDTRAALRTIFASTQASSQLSSAWLATLPPLSRSGADLMESTVEGGSFELQFGHMISHQLTRYTAMAAEHWALWQAASGFSISTKLKTCFPSAKAHLSYLESMLQVAVAPSDAQVVSKMRQARRMLRWMEMLEKSIYSAARGSITLATLSSHPSASFFKNNLATCMDWFIGMRKVAIKSSASFGSSYDVLRHALSRLSYLLKTVPNLDLAGPEHVELLLNLVNALISIGDADSLRALLALLSRPLSQTAESSPAQAASYRRLVSIVTAALAQSQGHFELALETYVQLASSPAPELESLARHTHFTTSVNQCIAALGHWSNVSDSLFAHISPLNASMMALCTADTSIPTMQKIAAAKMSFEFAQSEMMERPPSNTQSLLQYIDTALVEAVLEVSRNPESSSTVACALKQLPIAVEPFLSESVVCGSIAEVRVITQKLQVASFIGDTIDNKPSSLLVKELPLPSLTQAHTLLKCLGKQPAAGLTAKVVSSARKSGNIDLAKKMLEELQNESSDKVLAEAKLLGKQGKLVDGLEKLWQSSGVAEWLEKKNAGVSSCQWIDSSEAMKKGLAMCEMLFEGRREVEVSEYVGRKATFLSGNGKVDALREVLLEQLIQAPAEIQMRDYHDLECHLQYADAVYQRGTTIVKKSENDPLGVLPADMRDRLLAMCGGDAQVCDAVVVAVVPKCLTALVDENVRTSSSTASALLKRQLESHGVSIVQEVPQLSSALSQSSGPNLSSTVLPSNNVSDFLIAQWCSDLVNWLLTPYNRALQAYSRWLFLKASPGVTGAKAASHDAAPSYVDRALRASLRLLRLLTKYGDALLMVGECLDAVPAHIWKNVVPQLISRLGHVNFFVRNQVLKLLIKLATSLPDTVLYSALVRSSENIAPKKDAPSSAHNAPHGTSISSIARQTPIQINSNTATSANKLQRENLSRLKHALISLHPELVSDTQRLLTEFERITILFDETALQSVRDILNDVKTRKKIIDEESSRLQSLIQPIDKRIAMLKEKHRIVMAPSVLKLEKFLSLVTAVSRRSTTNTPSKFESSFATNVYPVVMRSISLIRDAPNFEADGQGRIAVLSLAHVVEDMETLVQKITTAVRRKTFSLSFMSPVVANLSKSCIPVPGQGSGDGVSSEKLTIQSFDDVVHVLSTKTRPKKLRLLGSNGQYFTFLLKGHEDLQLDERIMQILSTVNHLLKRDKVTRVRGEEARYYAVIPTGARSGIIQWVTGTIPLYQLFVDHQMRATQSHADAAKGDKSVASPPKFVKPMEMFFNKLHGKLNESGLSDAASRSQWPEKIVFEVFDELSRETPNDVFWKEMWVGSSDTEEHMKKVARYTKSVAAMSMIGYVIGLGDRHLDNLLLDSARGDIVHIDYNICFEGGMRLHVPEVVPFRLTQNMTKAMGVLGLEGTFKTSATEILRVLCQSRETLLTMLEAFVYDPLVDWKSERATAAPSLHPTTHLPAGHAHWATREAYYNDASHNAEIRVALTLFTDRLSLASDALFTPTEVTTTRHDFETLYNHAHLILHAKSEQAKVSASAKERAAQRKSLEATVGQLTSQLETLKHKMNTVIKPERQNCNLMEKQAEDALRQAISTARQVYIVTGAQKIGQLLSKDQTTEVGTDLYSLVLNPLPAFLETQTIPRTLGTFTTTQQWPQLSLTQLHRAKDSTALFENILSAFDGALTRSKRLLSTYRSIVNQMPEDYTSTLPVEEWTETLEQFLAAPSPEAHAELQQRLIAKYGSLEVLGKSDSQVNLNQNEEEALQNANFAITKLLSEIEVKKDLLARSQRQKEDLVVRAMRNQDDLQRQVQSVLDETAPPPGLVAHFNQSELVLKDAATRLLTNLTSDFKKEDAKNRTNGRANIVAANPFLSLFEPVPSSSFTDKATANKDTHSSVASLTKTLQTAHVFVMRIKTAFQLDPALTSPISMQMTLLEDPATQASPSLLEIPAHAEALLFELYSIASSAEELMTDMHSLSHLDANQLLLDFLHSGELTSPEATPVEGLIRLRNFFSVQLRPSHPLVVLDRMLGLVYARFMTMYTMITNSSVMPGVVEEIFTKGHVALFTQLTSSTQPLPPILAHLSSLLDKLFVDFIFDGIALRISRFAQVSSLASQLSPAIIASHQNIILKFNAITLASDTSAQSQWSASVASKQVDTYETAITDAQNELARIEWCVDHLQDKSPTKRVSMRRNLLNDMEKGADELSIILDKLNMVLSAYGKTEETVLQLMIASTEQSTDMELRKRSTEATNLFRNNCTLRHETITLLYSVAKEVLECTESVKRLESVRTGRVETRVCAVETRDYLSALSKVYEMDVQFKEVKSKMDHLLQQEGALRPSLNLLDVQMDVDQSMTKNFAAELKQARDSIVSIAQQVTRHLKFENQVERDLDSLVASIATLTRVYHVNDGDAVEKASGEAVAEKEAKEMGKPLSLIASIHRTSAQLQKVMKYLRTEIRCLASPLALYVLNPAHQKFLVSGGKLPSPASPGGGMSSSASASSVASSGATPFDPLEHDLPSGQQRLLDAHKLRKRLLQELDELARKWLQSVFEEGIDAFAMNAAGEEKEMDLSTPSSTATRRANASNTSYVPSASVNISATATSSSKMGLPTVETSGTSSAVATKTINILKRIQQKLEGSDPILFHTLPPTSEKAKVDLVTLAASIATPTARFSVQDHVNVLIAEATSPKNLSAMYEGWTPWI